MSKSIRLEWQVASDEAWDNEPWDNEPWDDAAWSAHTHPLDPKEVVYLSDSVLDDARGLQKKRPAPAARCCRATGRAGHW